MEAYVAVKIEDKVISVVLPIIEEFGYELVDVEYNKRKDTGNELVIYIDKPDGITLDDCEIVSRALDEPLDIADPIADSYVLCVSSPGIDRPLKNNRDYEKALDKEVEIKLYKKIDGIKDYIGTLNSYTDDTVSIIYNNKIVELNKSDIALIRMFIRF